MEMSAIDSEMVETIMHEALRKKKKDPVVREKRLREENPAVKDAWEKYQTVLALAIEDDPDETDNSKEMLSLMAQIAKAIRQEDIEKEIRESVPAVKEAWERYQALLKLAKS